MIRCIVFASALLVARFGLLPAQTQADLNAHAGASFHRADSTLNAIYGQLVARYRTDSIALRKVRAAEQAWLAFRDAQVAATYPASDKQAAYGSVYPMCVAELLTELTEARIAQLRSALNPGQGDVCAGGPA